jgi:hypothetical protein
VRVIAGVISNAVFLRKTPFPVQKYEIFLKRAGVLFFISPALKRVHNI